MERRKTRTVIVGGKKIGGDAPISVQSMTNRPANDFEGTYRQLVELADAGCDIVRMAVPDTGSAEFFKYAKLRGVSVPLVADIHFDYKIALEAVRCGADKIRINPGNIGCSENVKAVADACGAAGVPIRIGVNSGSLESGLIKKYGSPTPEAIAESAFVQAEMLEKYGFSDIVISIKSSDTAAMIEAARLVAKNTDYPLHLGVTEAGDGYSGLIKNSVGIGALLSEGIGDTLRVSLTADPREEVRAGREILKSLGLFANGGIDIVSCPTCGRTKVDIIGLVKKLKDETNGIDTRGKSIKVAVMGCVVNGPGEAREADIGVAGGDGFGVLFTHGNVIGRVDEDDIIPEMMRRINEIIKESVI